jgi:hypothetical protein
LGSLTPQYDVLLLEDDYSQNWIQRHSLTAKGDFEKGVKLMSSGPKFFADDVCSLPDADDPGAIRVYMAEESGYITPSKGIFKTGTRGSMECYRIDGTTNG